VAGFALSRNAEGEVTPHNHPDLQGDARILRGVHRRHIVPDANRGCERLSSTLFKNDPKRQGYLSFASEVCTEARGEDPAEYMLKRGWIGAVAMTVSQLRTFDPADEEADKWKIGMVPLEDEEPPDPCHGAMWGKISEGKANDIRRSVVWLVQVPDVVIDETKLPFVGGD
jgi:hypothetical protein